MQFLVYLCIVFYDHQVPKHRDLAQLVAHVVRDDEVAGSSPVIPTIHQKVGLMNIKDLFYLSKNDRQAVFALLAILIVCLSLVVVIGGFR